MKTNKQNNTFLSAFYVLLERHSYKILFVSIVIFALFLRIYNFENRWGLGSDDMRDVMISREALIRDKLPLLGSFSSAGPFVFGPGYYWFIMFSYILFPFTPQAPWVLSIIQSVMTVCILMYIGKRIGGNRLSLITGLIAATAQQLAYRATAISQHGLIGITASLVILFFVLFWQKRELKYIFLMGISLGFAFGMHTQAINLFIFFPTIFFVSKISFQKKLLAFIIIIIGFIIPLIPHMWWDYSQEWANIRNILDFILIGQHRLYVPNSWRLYLFKYFPDYWAVIAGGYNAISLPLYLSVFGFIVVSIFKKKIPQILSVLACILLILIIVNKSFKGERFEGYMIYFSPFIIIFTSWTFDRLLSYKKNAFFRIISLALLLIVLFGSTHASFTIINNAYNREKEIIAAADEIHHKYPYQKVELYDYKWNYSALTFPLSFFLKVNDKTSPNGIPIGMTCPEKKCTRGRRIITSISGYPIIELSQGKDLKKKSVWLSSNQENVYHDIIQWGKTKKLYSNFSIYKYVKNNIFHISK